MTPPGETRCARRDRHSAIAAVILAAVILAAVILAAAALLTGTAAPAGAHSGGRAQLYVDSVRLEPRADGWRAAVVVRDADSGRLEPGFGVQITGSGPAGEVVGPVSLADPDADGRYVTVVPITEGGWTLTVDAAEVPGGARALPFTKTWPVTFRAGQPFDLAASRPAGAHQGAGGGHTAGPRVPGLMAAGALAALLSLGLARRRTPGPGRPSPKGSPASVGGAAPPGSVEADAHEDNGDDTQRPGHGAPSR